jgi:hypothetical protein
VLYLAQYSTQQNLVHALSGQNVNVSIGANSYGMEEHAWRACEHACKAYIGYV